MVSGGNNMQAQTIKNLIMSFLITCLFVTTNSIAEDRFLRQDGEGFCISFRNVELDVLVQHIRQDRAFLQQQQKEQADMVEKQKFGVLDTIITIALPGGMMYAAIKTSKHYEQRQKLADLTEEINLLSGDLHIFETTNGKTRIAGLH